MERNGEVRRPVTARVLALALAGGVDNEVLRLDAYIEHLFSR